MNRNFFIRLAFAAHRVADVLPQKEQVVQEIREGANTILADLLLLVEKESVKPEKKQDILFQLERQIDVLLVYLDRAKKQGWVNAENFTLLEEEYGKMREFLEIFENIQGLENQSPGKQKPREKEPVLAKERVYPVSEETAQVPHQNDKQIVKQELLTHRQKRIIEFLRTKTDAQVWELQKVLPEVTKRTLRRDLDELLQKKLIERKGAWNAVAYELK